MAKSIIVTQIGARHRYLIPRILHKHGLLYYLFTDSCRYSLLGKLSETLSTFGITTQLTRRLVKRDPQIPKSLIKSSDYLTLKRFINRKSSSLQKYITIYQSMSSIFKKYNIENADCIYNMYFENIDFLKYVKHKGKKIIVDIYENPKAFAELIEEIKRNPEYASLGHLIDEYIDKHILREKYIEDLFEIADYYTVPSLFVLNAIKNYTNFKLEKAFILPYPTSIKPKTYNYHPRRHTLIWVGNDPVRKGLIYCAKAATILKKKYSDLDFRIIGKVDDKIIKNSAFKDLHFIGVLNAKELQQEYETAEAYVFPTLFEGFAGTVIEAASCGCPIITTEGAGTDMDNFPAIYIPRYNYEAIISAVISIFENPNIRNELSKKTFEYAKCLSADVYEKNLINIIDNVQ